MNAEKLFGTTDLYKILNIDPAASINEIKKSYYQQARIYHPDKSSGVDKTSAAERFNIIHQAYIVLSNPESRNKYNESGSKLLFARPTIAAEWEKYLKTITTEDFSNASTLFKGSDEEKTEILKEFVKGKGSMVHVFNTVPFLRPNDEPRIREMVQKAIEIEEIPRIAIKKLPKNY